MAARLLALLALCLTLAGIGAAAAPDADAAKRTRAQVLVGLARAELAKGVREIPDGSNRAPAIRRYVASTRPSWFGAPWCAYFVSYLAKRAGVPIGPGGNGLGYVPTIRAWAKSTGRWRTRPRPGYLVTWPQHVGIVETVSANGTMTTIEGNSANAVRRRYRRSTDASGFVALAAGGAIQRRPVKRRPVKRRTPVKEAALRARITFYPSATVHLGDELHLTANDSSGPVEKVRWDLDGDGAFDDARGDSAQMRVVKRGRHRVAVRVYSRSGKHATASESVTVLGANAPTARLSLPAETIVGTKVVADASGSTDPDGDELKYEWDTDGDGDFGRGGNQQAITFRQPGVHQVTVKVTDGDGSTSQASQTITVLEVPAPTVAVKCDRTAALTRERVTCQADTSGSPTRASRIEWDTDDDGRFGARGTTVRASWSAPGTYPVRVRAVGANGRESVATIDVQIANRAPVAAVRVPSSVKVGDALTLDASSSTDADGRVAAVRWDVGGDGTYELTGTKATFRPDTAGRLRIVAEVTDDAGATHTASAEVDVRGVPLAVLTVLTDDPLVNQDVLLTAKDSSSPGTTLTRCQWDVTSDGRWDHTTSDCTTTVRVVYTRTGDKTVTLKVTDAFGATHTTKATLTVR